MKKLLTQLRNKLFGAPVYPSVLPPKGYQCYQFGDVIVVERNARQARKVMEAAFKIKLQNVKFDK